MFCCFCRFGELKFPPEMDKWQQFPEYFNRVDASETLLAQHNKSRFAALCIFHTFQSPLSTRHSIRHAKSGASLVRLLHPPPPPMKERLLILLFYSSFSVSPTSSSVNDEPLIHRILISQRFRLGGLIERLVGIPNHVSIGRGLVGHLCCFFFFFCC